jgi:hypothetical protein
VDIYIYCPAGIFSPFIQRYHQGIKRAYHDSFYLGEFQEFLSAPVFKHFVGFHLPGGNIHHHMPDAWLSCSIYNFKSPYF